MECCIDKNIFKHDNDNLADAIGVSSEEKIIVSRIVDDALKLRRVSEMIELIWSSECLNLTTQGKVYATFRLGIEVYRIIVEGMLREAERTP
ncbi:MAG: hypothetical protein QXR02_02935 [Acidilobaceae archaeon]